MAAMRGAVNAHEAAKLDVCREVTFFLFLLLLFFFIIPPPPSSSSLFSTTLWHVVAYAIPISAGAVLHQSMLTNRKPLAPPSSSFLLLLLLIIRCLATNLVSTTHSATCGNTRATCSHPCKASHRIRTTKVPSPLKHLKTT